MVALVVDDEHGALTLGLSGGRFDPCFKVAQDSLILLDDADGFMARHHCFAGGWTDLPEIPRQDFQAAFFADGAREPCPAWVVDSDEILAITSAGTVMRTQASEIRQTGRDSMGVRLVNLDEGATLLTVTRSREDEISEEK